MVKLKEILYQREIEMIDHYQWNILNADIEDTATIKLYQNEITRIIEHARERHYKENPAVAPLKREESVKKENIYKDKLKVRDLLTKEEQAEIEFLKWRLIKSYTPWGRKRKEKKIESIIAEAMKRSGYTDIKD